MRWHRIPLGPLQTNAYVLENDQKECIIFDPGAEGERLNEWLEEQQLKPTAILLTHAHFDHIGGVDEVRDQWKIPVYIHQEEKNWLVDPALNGSEYFGMIDKVKVREADHLLKEEQTLTVGNFTFQVFETPGHSPGSVSYYLEECSVVFAGDALFARSIGRTDLRGGDHDQLLDSIHKKLLTLPEATVVAPGHGPETTIQTEMDENPFLNGFSLS